LQDEEEEYATEIADTEEVINNSEEISSSSEFTVSAFLSFSFMSSSQSRHLSQDLLKLLLQS